MTMTDTNLIITKSDKRWKVLKKTADKILLTTLNYFKLAHGIEFLKPVQINLNLSNDEEIQKLNLEFRGKDQPTNVLSFANIDDENFVDSIGLFDEIEFGDIIISYDTVEREAAKQNISLNDHFTHLFIHGILHLLGFDHMEDEEAEEMETAEIKILEILNIKNPYTE